MKKTKPLKKTLKRTKPLKKTKSAAVKRKALIVRKPKFEVVNIVASADLQLDLDLYTIALKVYDVEYEPEQFPGAIFKMVDPVKSSLLLFKNGKIICTGCKSEKEVQKALSKTASILEKYASPLVVKK